MSYAIAITLGLIAFFVHYYSESFFIKNKLWHIQAKSFAAGIAIAYIFLELIPRALPNEKALLFFFFILFGFVLHHILDKYIYQHAEGSKLRRELREEHTLFFTIYHILVGIALVFFLRQDILGGLFFFTPVILHDLLSSAALRHVYEPIKKNKTWRILLCSTMLIGVLIGLFVLIPESLNRGLTGFIGGILLYAVARDTLPRYREGSPLYFVLGVLTMIGFLTVTLF